MRSCSQLIVHGKIKVKSFLFSEAKSMIVYESSSLGAGRVPAECNTWIGPDGEI